MLLKVRLPASIPPIPKMPLSMTDVDLTLSALPSSSTILLSLVAVFVLLSFVRALFIGLREHLAFVRGRKALQQQTQPASFSATSAASSPAAPAIPPPSPTLKEKSISSNGTPAPTIDVPLRRPMSSWLWGLVKWDTLPSFPLDITATPSRQAGNNLSSTTQRIGAGAGVGLSEKRGGWREGQQQQQQQMAQVNNGRRPPPISTARRPGGPAFERPLPTLYQTDMPVSMAKMIMSRHTFRRPSSRPPPARSASVQIQPAPRRASSPAPPSRSPSPPSAASLTSAPPSTTPQSQPRAASPPPQIQAPVAQQAKPTTQANNTNNNNSIPTNVTIPVSTPPTTTNTTTTTSPTKTGTLSTRTPPPIMIPMIQQQQQMMLQMKAPSSRLARPAITPPSRSPSPPSPQQQKSAGGRRSPSPSPTLGAEEVKILEEGRSRSTSPV